MSLPVLSPDPDPVAEEHVRIAKRSRNEHGESSRSSGSLNSINPDLLLNEGAKQIISLFVPVTICMFCVVVIARTVPYFSTTDVYLVYTPFHTPGADLGTQVWQTVANVLIFLGVIVVMTFLLVFLFKYKCYKCLHVWLIATTFLLVFVISFIFFTEVLRTSGIFFDNITFAILLWNFGLLGLVAIHWKSPLILQQAYLIFNSVQLALIFLKFLPKWTCWVLLGALAIWDLVAVLCPKGPLRMLVEMAHERQQPLFPAMIYSTTVAYLLADENPDAAEQQQGSTHVSSADQSDRTEQGLFVGQTPGQKAGTSTEAGNTGRRPHGRHHKQNPSTEMSNGVGGLSVAEGDFTETSNTPPLAADADHPLAHEMTPIAQNSTATPGWSRLRELQEDLVARQETGVKLGLGDFIFYSLLVGRAAVDGDVLTVVACYVAILVGMCITIVALSLVGKALPALPVSIACGILFYFTTALVISPFIAATSEHRLYF
uniref:Presenilin n=2 Tax=Schistocephalus solidus TaxID=70667 RepID=A0A0X3P1V8_SCHSO